MYMLYILAVIAIIIVFFLFIPINIIFEKRDTLRVYYKILFVKIPFHKKKRGDSKKKKTAPKKRNILAIVKKISSMTTELIEVAKYISDRCMVVNELLFNLEFGTGDAAQTGIANGILNTVAYSILSAVHNHTLLKKWDVQIQPDFENEKFDYTFLCIVQTRLLHIISVANKGFVLYKKYKNK